MEEIELNENKPKVLDILPSNRFFNYFNKIVPSEISKLISADEYRVFIKELNKLKSPFAIRLLAFIDILLGILILPLFFVLFQIMDLRLISIIVVSVNSIMFLTLFCILTFSNWKMKYRNKMEIRILEINNSLRGRKIPLMFRILFNNNNSIDDSNNNNTNNNNIRTSSKLNSSSSSNNSNNSNNSNSNNNNNNNNNINSSNNSRFKEFEMILEATYTDDINSIPSNSLCIGEAQC